MFFRSLVSLYDFRLTSSLVTQLREARYSGWKLLHWFWHTTSFRVDGRLNEAEQSFAVLLGVGMAAQVVAGITLLVQWARFGTDGSLEFGIALLLSYPLVWAHLLALGAGIGRMVYFGAHPKKAGRAIVCSILELQVRQLRARHDFKVVAVVGSVGKTSTKLAIADLLAQSVRVRHQVGNYNDRVTVPLVLFGQSEPNILNVFAWLKVFGATQSEIALPYPYDVVVVELGTDGPGQLSDFAYLKPDITVVTAVSPEHMEFFKTIDAVALEELAVFDFSQQVLVNGDDIAGTYLAGRIFREYSLLSKQAQYQATRKPKDLHGQALQIHLAEHKLQADVAYIGAQGAKFALAAAAVGDMLGLPEAQIEAALSKLKHFSGRMQVLPGRDGTTLIDDTYNSTPLAAKAALDVLYAAKTPQRIAILGAMNELGDYSHQAHREVGQYCDAQKLDVVVTIGADAEKWLAPAAQKNGCIVESFASPYDAGEYVKNHLKKGAVVLAKGSQNGVFAEEALKPLLAHKSDEAKLVRQTAYWLKKKQSQFNG